MNACDKMKWNKGEGMISKFGNFIRKVRSKENESLRKMASKLGITPSFLSDMEVGRKTIPLEYLNKISELYNLSDDEVIEFENSIYETNEKVSIELDIMNEAQRDISLLFARKIKTADDKLLEKLREALLNEEDKSN